MSPPAHQSPIAGSDRGKNCGWAGGRRVEEYGTSSWRVGWRKEAGGQDSQGAGGRGRRRRQEQGKEAGGRVGQEGASKKMARSCFSDISNAFISASVRAGGQWGSPRLSDWPTERGKLSLVDTERGGHSLVDTERGKLSLVEPGSGRAQATDCRSCRYLIVK